jgi:hypothetical protein
VVVLIVIAVLAAALLAAVAVGFVLVMLSALT